MSRSAEHGFSIIELSVALTIAGVLLALGAPALSGYLQNARLGATAKSVYTGLQLARTEAVKLNHEVEFVLTNSPLETSTPDSVSLDVTGRNWMVRQRAPTAVSYELVEQKAATGNGNDAGGVALAANFARVTFNSIGGSTAGANTVIALSNPNIGLCAPSGPVRCWNVVVAPGGQVRMCSPDATLPVGDSRAC